MKFSYKWLQEWVPLERLGSLEALSESLACKGLEIDAIESLGQGFEKVVVGLIEKKERHPQADRLHICQVFDGQHKRQIVCGAQNMKEGDKVALALPGAQLPNGLNIKASSIRGQESFGMLCSEPELGLKDLSEGIWILDATAEPGKPLGDLLGLSDYLLEIKIPANRPDLLGHYGLARELSMLFALPLKDRAPLPSLPPKGDLTLTVKTPLASAFSLTKIRLLRNKKSPWAKKLRHFGFAQGRGPLVDATNLTLLEMGHPTHAYDAHSVGNTFIVEEAVSALKMNLIGTGEKDVPAGAVLVKSQDKAIALAGITGSQESSIQDHTREAILEAAAFDKNAVRALMKACQLKTESGDRFSRGVDPWDCVLERLLFWLQELAEIEILAHVSWERQYVAPRIPLKPPLIRARLGVSDEDAVFSNQEIRKVLYKLGCSEKKQAWEPPSFRGDLLIPEDLIEEILRIKGLEHIPAVLPLAPSPLSKNSYEERMDFCDLIKDFLIQEGFDECKHYPYVSKTLLDVLGIRSELPLLNPLSEEMKWLSPSLIPGWIQTLRRSQNHHFGLSTWAFRGFECRPVFLKDEHSETGVREPLRLAIALTGPRDRSGFRSSDILCTFRDVQTLLLKLAERLGLPHTRFEPMEQEKSVWQAGQSANWLHPSGKILGACGKLHPMIGLKQAAFLMELDLDLLLSFASQKIPKWTSWPLFPCIERDLTLQLGLDIPVQRVLKEAQNILRGATVTLLDVFTSAEYRHVTLRARFQNRDRSLLTEEVDPIIEQAKVRLGEKKW